MLSYNKITFHLHCLYNSLIVIGFIQEFNFIFGYRFLYYGLQHCCFFSFSIWLQILDSIPSRNLKIRKLSPAKSFGSILNVKWEYDVTKTKVMERTNSQSFESLIVKYHLWWSGHVVRMVRTRFLRQISSSEILSREKTTGLLCSNIQGPTQNSGLKRILKATGLERKSLETQARWLTNWRCFIKIGTKTFEPTRK